MTTGAFIPTHTAPPGGLLAWNVPEADRLVVGQISGGDALELMELHANWARVRRADGFVAWVDATGLQSTVTKARGWVALLILLILIVLVGLGIFLYIKARMTLGQPANIFTQP